MKKIQAFFPSVFIVAMVFVLVYLVSVNKNEKEKDTPSDLPENKENDTEISDGVTSVTATENYTEYGKMVSKMNKELQSVKPMSLEETAKCKLLVHAKTEIDLGGHKPVWIVQGPDYHYTLQFTDVASAEAALKWLSKQTNIIYVEQDSIITLRP